MTQAFISQCFQSGSLDIWIGAGYFLCPWCVYLLGQSFPIFYCLQTDMSGLDEHPVEIAFTVQEWPLAGCCRRCCQAQPAGNLWPLRAKAVRAILENLDVARELSSSQPFPEAIPMFQGSILQQNLQPL